MPKLKTCTKCKTKFPATIKYFSVNVGHKDGLHSYCRVCGREYDRRYNKSEKGKIAVKKYHQSEKGKIALKAALERFNLNHPGYQKERRKLHRKQEQVLHET